MARDAADLRELAGVVRPKGEGVAGSVELATEVLALAAAGRNSPPEPAELEEQTKRLSARVLLNRWIDAGRQLPVTDEELSRAYLQEVERYWATGESELYRPTLIQASAITIGLFPDGDAHSEDGLPPVRDRAAIERLAERVRREAGDRVADTDTWISLARRFSEGNPTLRLQPQIQVSLDPERARVAPVLYRSIVALDGAGSVSPVVWTEGAAWIIRRGVTFQGKGERPDEIRAELERIVRRERDQARIGTLLAELKRRYPVRLVPGALRGAEPPGGAAP